MGLPGDRGISLGRIFTAGANILLQLKSPVPEGPKSRPGRISLGVQPLGALHHDVGLSLRTSRMHPGSRIAPTPMRLLQRLPPPPQD